MHRPLTHLLYLHGFRSSPRSAKAQRLASLRPSWQAAGLEITWACPQLPPSPRQAMQEIEWLIADWPHESMAVIGSSLGGFYATVVAQGHDCEALVINPAVNPARDLARQMGTQTRDPHPDDHFYFKPEFIDEFKALDPFPITRPERYWALIAEGDEVLDWREMVSHYEGARIKLLDGSDHAVSDFDEHLPDLLRVLGLPPHRSG